MRYTTDPPRLILPTQATIKHLVKRAEMEELSDLEWDFVWDLLAKTGGAQVAEFDEDAALMDAGIYALLEAETFLQSHPQANRGNVHEKFEREYHQMQHQLHHILEHLDLNDIPGYNHASKAIRVIELVRYMKVLWIMYVIYIDDAGILFELIERALEKVHSLSSEDLSTLKEFVDSDEEASNFDTEFLALQLEIGGIDLKEVLRIARHLDTLSELQRNKSKLRSDPNGEDVKPRSIRDLSELGRISQQDHALPHRLRMKRAVEGELNVRDPHTRRNKKQLLYLVVDGSVSMLNNNTSPASHAAGVVVNRLQAVIDGDAEVYVRFFDRELREKEYHACNIDTARELITVVGDVANYTGGNTVFSSTLMKASTRVLELMKSGDLKEPELVFITDGDAALPDISVLQGVRMHVVQVGDYEVPALSNMARQSGGISVYTGKNCHPM